MANRIFVTGGAGFIGQAQESFADGMRKTVLWYLEHRGDWREMF